MATPSAQPTMTETRPLRGHREETGKAICAAPRTQRAPAARRSLRRLLLAPLLLGAIALGSAGEAKALFLDLLDGLTGGQFSAPPRPPVAVRLETSLGTIDLELNMQRAPISGQNFLNYVDAGFYDGTIFHNMSPGYWIEGGHFDADRQRKRTRPPILHEGDNGLSNLRGTVSVSLPGASNSGTSGFFINVRNNTGLDYVPAVSIDRPPVLYGYAVFGRVVAGMEVVDAMVAAPSTSVGRYTAAPVDPVVIVSARRAP